MSKERQPFVNAFQKAVLVYYTPVAEIYGVQLNKQSDVHYVFQTAFCSVHILIYFGHTYSVSVVLEPQNTMRNFFPYESIGLGHIANCKDAGFSVIQTESDIEAFMAKSACAIQHHGNELILGDTSAWSLLKKRIAPLIDRVGPSPHPTPTIPTGNSPP